MRNVDQALEHLIDSIKETEQYKNYRTELEKVKKFPQLKAQIDEFRRRNFELQNAQVSEDEMLRRVEAFEQEYEKFREDAMVSDFLAAELDFVRLVQEITDRLTVAIDFK